MRQGGSIGPGGLSKRKRGAPLRRVVETLVRYGNIFKPDHVRLECGHEAESWGGVRARCPTCRDSVWVAIDNSGEPYICAEPLRYVGEKKSEPRRMTLLEYKALRRQHGYSD